MAEQGRKKKEAQPFVVNKVDASNEDLRLFEQLRQAVFYCDVQLQISAVNPAVHELFGVHNEEIIGLPLAQVLLSPDGEIPFDELLDSDEARWQGLLPLRMGSGQTARCDVRLLRQVHRYPGIVCIVDDRSEIEAMERSLEKVRNLAKVGELSSGIAHEINTPTQYVSDNTDFLQDAFNSLVSLLKAYEKLYLEAQSGVLSEEALAAVKEARRGADLDFLTTEIPRAVTDSLEGLERVNQMVRALREFAYQGSRDHQPLDINHQIQTTVTLARNEWKYVADLEAELDANLPTVLGKPNEINQVVLNLLVNSAHAIQEQIAKGSPKGQIVIKTYAERGWVVIELSDTGGGIPEDAKERLFEPFFTTKAIGKGTGQGLAIVKEVVDKYGATIDYTSTQGVGTTFVVRFPSTLILEE